MSGNLSCPIWGTPVSRNIYQPTGFVSSPRTGGEYYISGTEYNIVTSDEYFKARLTSWLVEQRLLGVRCPEITPRTIEEVRKRRELTVHQRADRLLQYIHQASSVIGEQVTLIGANLDEIHAQENRFDEISDGFFNRYRMMAWTECTTSNQFEEVEFLLEYLQRKEWIEYNLTNCVLTVEGYARLAELEKIATDSSQAFVAMWFDESMDDVYQNGIKPGIEDAGFNPLPINKKEHINKIDDEIIAEIRRSRFVVADFTHGESGARGGVYYEAGFAYGLNIPVIFTCRKDLLEKNAIHFDTRQFNHIPWEPEKPEELRKALANRIAHVIGDGPNKTQDAG